MFFNGPVLDRNRLTAPSISSRNLEKKHRGMLHDSSDATQRSNRFGTGAKGPGDALIPGSSLLSGQLASIPSAYIRDDFSNLDLPTRQENSSASRHYMSDDSRGLLVSPVDQPLNRRPGLKVEVPSRRPGTSGILIENPNRTVPVRKPVYVDSFAEHSISGNHIAHWNSVAEGDVDDQDEDEFPIGLAISTTDLLQNLRDPKHIKNVRYGQLFAEASEDYKANHGEKLDVLKSRGITTAATTSSSYTFREEQSNSEDSIYCCQDCQIAEEQNVPDVYFCPACGLLYREACWKKQSAHRRGRNPGHDRVKPEVAKWVSDTLQEALEEDEQARLHVFDNSALWFGAGFDDNHIPVFRDFGRYADLVSEMIGTQQNPPRQFPSLISFVGETGAGKSSLIKLLITMQSGQHQTPVVGSNLNDDTPTSGDVHLYKDPNTINTLDPLLYADCEGLNGGSRIPIGAKWKNRRNSFIDAIKTQNSQPRLNKNSSSEREIQWASSLETSTRDYFVRHLYPRLLYTFSDVIVFVQKNVRAIENVIEQLITWADAAREASSNQPVLPHAIIVLNASDNDNDLLWDVETSTNDLLEKLEEAMQTNKQFSQLARTKCHGTTSIRKLLNAYYSSVQVVRVPDRMKPTLIRAQVDKLYHVIRRASKQTQDFKSGVRMKLSGDELLPYLQKAFDHFCKTLKRPFDFVKASYANCTIPSDFCGNTLKLALNILEQWPNRLDGELIFRELSFLLASCTMLDAVRRGVRGITEAMMQNYVVHFDEVLEEFCDRYWPCEFVCRQGRCTNVKAGHSKGHQVANGRIVNANAQYVSTFTFEKHRGPLLDEISQYLDQLIRKLASQSATASTDDEKEAAFTIHRDFVLRHFYRHIGGAQKFVNHSFCLACLVFAPEHCLPCGHILCTPCVKAVGKKRGTTVELHSCPLHDDIEDKSGVAFRAPWTIPLHPDSAGARVLILDGGGIRSIAELLSLKHIEHEFQGLLKVQSFFDLIIGTGTGGIIALGLGEKDWSANEGLERFKNLSYKSFARSGLLKLKVIDKIWMALKTGQYDIRPLEQILSEEFGEDLLFGGTKMRAGHGDRISPRVAVTATHVGSQSYLLANYNRPETSEHPIFTFLRAESPKREIKTWEAARATSAAPKIFGPFEHKKTGLSFIDGGIRHNNPINLAMEEYKTIFPQLEGRQPDIVLSLGAGYSTNKKSEGTPLLSSVNAMSYYNHLMKIATNNLQHALNTEETWKNFYYTRNSEDQHRYRRLNFTFKEKCPKTDEASKILQFEEAVESQLRSRNVEIKEIANQLLASSFYFVMSGGPNQAQRLATIKGHLQCRFPPGSDEVRALGKLINQKRVELYKSWPDEAGPSFVIHELGRDAGAKHYVITSEITEKMVTDGEFRIKTIHFPVRDLRAQVNIRLRLCGPPQNSYHHSISGFPKNFLTEYQPKLQRAPSFNRRRVVTSRPAWSMPTVSCADIDHLGVYARSDHPGLASKTDMMEVSQKLSYNNDAQGLQVASRVWRDKLPTFYEPSGSENEEDNLSELPPSSITSALPESMVSPPNSTADNTYPPAGESLPSSFQSRLGHPFNEFLTSDEQRRETTVTANYAELEDNPVFRPSDFQTLAPSQPFGRISNHHHSELGYPRSVNKAPQSILPSELPATPFDRRQELP